MRQIFKALALTALFAVYGCSSGSSKPKEHPTCDGQPWGSVMGRNCPNNAPGDWKQVCTDDGWADVTNTCQAVPPPAPPPAPPKPGTCDGKALGTIDKPSCPAGEKGEWTRVCTSKGWNDVLNTCTLPPPPPPALKVSLPSIYRIHKGDPLMLGVKPQDGVTYKWSDNQSGSMIWVQPDTEETITVTATRAADGVKGSASVYVMFE